ncbi:MAG: hypothetical protein QGG62_03340 [Candidatus Poseidoniaceae archaeon]|nr:hypothetical protein [Candidatus Poseidoniaceae archaeon]
MGVPFSDEASLRWALIAFEFLIGIVLIYNSKNQPFPRPSSRFGWLVILITILVLIGQAAPKPMTVFAHFVMLSGIGGFGLVAGVYQLAQTQRDVLVAPYAGMMFCVGVVGLMVLTWDDLSKVEQWAGFLTIVVLGGGETWLIFRGLLIGKLPRAWSQAGMIALMQGRLTGRNGAIECFEKGWDVNEEHLNPMAYVALHRIHLFLGQDEEAQTWKDHLDREGGESAVAHEYIQAIHDALTDHDPQAAERLPIRHEEE